MKNKKELCLKRVKQYIQQFKNDKDFRTCPTIDHEGFTNKHNDKLKLKALDTIAHTIY